MSEQSSEALGAAVRFIARRNDQIQRALQVLQNAQRYDYGSEAYMEDPLQPSEAGDWILIDDVVKAIQILQEGQQ